MNRCKFNQRKKDKAIPLCLLYLSISLMFFLGFFLYYVRSACAKEELIVSSASSLTNVIKDIGRAFETENKDTKVIFNFAGSGALYIQIANGAPVDVFASADQLTMDQAEKEKLIVPVTRKNFARNTLVLVTPIDLKIPVLNLQGLSQPQVKRIAIGKTDTVPVGRYSKEVLVNNKLWDKLAPKLIMANSVRQVLDYVTRGEVDAGFIYKTDAAVSKESVKIVEYLDGHTPVVYPIAVVAASKKQDRAEKFLDFVLSLKGQEILSKYGFLKT